MRIDLGPHAKAWAALVAGSAGQLDYKLDQAGNLLLQPPASWPDAIFKIGVLVAMVWMLRNDPAAKGGMVEAAVAAVKRGRQASKGRAPSSRRAKAASPVLVGVAALALLFLAGCGVTPQGDALREAAKAKGEKVADTSLESAEAFVCEVATVGSIMRRYGASEEMWGNWAGLCLGRLQAATQWPGAPFEGPGLPIPDLGPTTLDQSAGGGS